MRIILVVNIFPSASETFISNKVKWLAAGGYHITVLCTKYDKELFRALFTDSKNIIVDVIQKNGLPVFLLMNPLLAMRQLRKKNGVRQLFKNYRLQLIRKHAPDIIHIEFSGIGTDYLYELKHLNCKKVVSCRGSAEKVKLLVYEDRRENFRALINIVDAVHCVSDDMRKTVFPYCNDSSKIFINPPAIDPIFFNRQQERTLRNEVLLLLSVGRLTFQKGYTTGIQAAYLLKQAGQRFKWLIVGHGPEYEQLVFQVHHFGLEEHIQLLGTKPASEVKGLMEQADIFFLPSVYEGIANVVLEAMSMQLPVVATRSGGMEEVIIHGENGLLANTYDHIGLADYLLQLLNNASMRNSIGICARKTIEEKFSPAVQTGRYVEVYSRLVR